jgi:hypothetical protein
MLKIIDVSVSLRVFLSKLGIKSARQRIILWDPYQNGGVGGEIEVEI